MDKDIILLGNPIPQKYIHVMKVNRKNFEIKINIYCAYVWNDGSLQIGYPSCSLTYEEFSNLILSSPMVIEKVLEYANLIKGN